VEVTVSVPIQLAQCWFAGAYIGTVFLEVWKRQRATLAYEWDVTAFESSEPDRPQFIGTREIPVCIRVAHWLVTVVVTREHY